MEDLRFLLDYDVFIFDFDGTLVDSNKIKYDGFLEVTKSIDNAHSILKALLATNTGATRSEIFVHLSNELTKKNISHAAPAELIRHYSNYCEGRVAEAIEIPFAFQMLQKLKEHQRQVFLSSATPVQELRRIVEKKGWRHLFDGIYGAPRRKSSHIISIKKKTGSGVRKILFCGDSVSDQIAAAASGCDFIGIGRGGSEFQGRLVIWCENFEKWMRVLQQD